MSTHNAPILALPNEEALQILLSVLDQMDNSVSIVRKDGLFFYYNQKYWNTYRDSWSNALPGEIYQHTLNELDGAEAKMLQNILESEESMDKYFNKPSETAEDVFSDVFPIYIHEEMFGIAVVEYRSEQIRKLNHQLNYYKSLSMSLQHQLYDKSTLPPFFRNIIGESAQMVQVLAIGAQVAQTQSSVCLLGESGTGKEVMAEAIHASSKNSSGPLIKVNCAAIPETLIESELFGYEKGAFTGANPQGSVGKFELANGGTLFLDEIGEMPLAMQAKLLRALQEKEITRIGGSKPIKLNFRLITATNKDLEQMMRDGTFREDLYYRICIIPIHLPPLRSRRGDIPLLANQFLALFNTNPNQQRTFPDEVLEQFTEYNWPGNIRELKNCVERMSILCPDDMIGTDYLPPQIAQHTLPGTGFHSENQYNLRNILEKTEYDAIKAVLGMTNGNKAQAIRILGISKRNFYMKLERYGLK